MPREGDTVGRYVIEGILGEGGMGVVYRARDPVLDRSVALKVVRAAPGANSPQAIARLLREARSAAALVHPNAVAIYDVGEIEGNPFIAMELVSGRSLRERLEEPGPGLGWSQKLRWLVDVARVLDAAHQQGIIHRDIKPDNVMVREDGTVKVLDFGIARRVDTPLSNASGHAATITAEGATIGTPMYMAPEQMLGEPVDGRADQFAWGVTAYEVLTGHVPWGNVREPVQVMGAILKKEAPPFRDTHPEIPPQVEAAILRALAKEPDDRHATMLDLAEELQHLAAPRTSSTGAPSSRTPRSSGTRRPPPARPKRPRWAMPAAAAVTIALLAAGATVALRARTTEIAASPLASSSASARPVAITDLPAPQTANPEALAAYRSGVQAIRDGAVASASENFARATKLDPSLAAAHLRFALYGSIGGVPSRSGSAFQRAMQLRSSLSSRDQELLSAMEPYMGRDRVDLAETTSRLVALSNRHPDDAEIAYFLAVVRFDTDARAMMGELDRASALDPSFVPPIALRAHGLAYLGDFEGARAAFAACAAASPTSSMCAHYRASLEAQDGDCAGIEAGARRVLSSEPSSVSALSNLANALASLGRPRELVAAVLEQKAAKTSEAQRQQIALRDRARLELLYGDFEAAEAHATELSALVSSAPAQAAHAAATMLLIDLAMETGRPRDASRAADAFMKVRDAWVPPHNVEDYSIRDDATVPMLTTMYRAGTLTREGFRAKRDLWLDSWVKVASPFYLPYLWVHAFAVPAETKDDAEEAIGSLQRWGGVPRYRSQMLVDGSIGNAYWLAGRRAEALPFLRRGAGCCLALTAPSSSTRASFFLGAALEQEGDKPGACAAYKVVLDRWGSAKRSVTASLAKTRWQSLACK